MALPTCNEDMNIISKLDDEPNDVGGLSAASLKAKFDLAGNLLKKALNDLVAALGNNAAAKSIGFTPTTAVNKTNVQDAIENVQAQIAGVSQGGIADGAVSTAKIADGAITADKLAAAAVTSDKIPEAGLMSDAHKSLTFSVDSTVCHLTQRWAQYCAATGMMYFRARFSGGLSSADLSSKLLEIKPVLLDGGAVGGKFTTFGLYVSEVSYKPAGSSSFKSVTSLESPTTNAAHENVILIRLPDDIGSAPAKSIGITICGWYKCA